MILNDYESCFNLFFHKWILKNVVLKNAFFVLRSMLRCHRALTDVDWVWASQRKKRGFRRKNIIFTGFIKEIKALWTKKACFFSKNMILKRIIKEIKGPWAKKMLFYRRIFLKFLKSARQQQDSSKTTARQASKTAKESARQTNFTL